MASVVVTGGNGLPAPSRTLARGYVPGREGVDVTKETTLIVLAHPEPRSFSAAWARASATAVAAGGGQVLWSDLYAQGFDPAERAGHFPPADGPFDVLKSQERAAAAGTLPAEVAAEVEKIRAADRIILHFPIWWFGPPAMLKGWCDRALVHGALHDVDRRFDTGPCRGKEALFCVSTGARAAEAGHDGREGDIGLLLWPLAHTLRYLGIIVRAPLAVHGVHGYHKGAERDAMSARLAATLAGQAAAIAGWRERPEIRFNADTDFDADGRLKPGAPSHSPFIRHDP